MGSRQPIREVPAFSLSTCGSASRPFVPLGDCSKNFEGSNRGKVLTFGGREVASKRDFRLHFTLSWWHFLGDLPFYLYLPVLIVRIDAAAII